MSTVNQVPCNQNLHTTFDLLSQGAAFVNPTASMIDNIKTGGYGKIDAIEAFKQGLNPLSPTYLQDQQTLDGLKAKLVEMVGQSDGTNFSQSPLGQFLIWTDFSSGKGSSRFPLGDMAAVFEARGVAQPAGLALLGTAGFLTVLSLAGSGKTMNQELCNYDPQDPCATLTGIFGSVVGAFNTALQQILDFLNSMVDFLANAAAFIDQINDYINQLLDQIITEITNLCQLLLNSLNYALAKLLDGLKLDPCVRSLLTAVGANQLKQALGI
jgi:hypothetical protein